MALDPSALLVGPRGRRLCLEVAGTSPEDTGGPLHDELRTALMYAAYDLDPGRGTSRAMFGPGIGHEDGSRPSSSDVARLLSTVPLVPVTERLLMRSLGAAVDFARYWQEPDGEDVLAASTQVSDALRRVVEHVARSAQAVWWTTPLDRTAQWTATPADPRRPSAPEGTVGQRLARWREEAMSEEARARRVRPRDPRASWSGTWWSTPPADLTRTTRSLGRLGPVGLWLVEDADGSDRATVAPVTVPARARVYEVDGPEAWAELCRRYPLDVTAARRHDWYRTTGVDRTWVVPDWSRVAEHLDAVHVTVAGYLTTAGRAVAVADGVATVLAGWAPDRTSWLVDVEEVDAAEQVWTRDDDGTTCGTAPSADSTSPSGRVWTRHSAAW